MVHLIYHTSAIEEARSEGKLAVGSFIRIQKRFKNKRPTLHVDEFGDANAFLQNSSHFQKETDLFLRGGVHEVQPTGGWLGQYQTMLRSELRNPDRRKRENSGRGGHDSAAGGPHVAAGRKHDRQRRQPLGETVKNARSRPPSPGLEHVRHLNSVMSSRGARRQRPAF